MREPKVVFVGIAIVLLVLLLVVAAEGSSGSGASPDTSSPPSSVTSKHAADQLDANLDRIAELGR